MDLQLKSEIVKKYKILCLGENVLVESFDCGDVELNEFILQESPLYRKALLAVSYVVVSRDDIHNVVGYFSVANDKVALGDFASNNEFNRFRRKQGFPQSKRIKSYPALKICRFGVSKLHKGEGLGTFMLDFVKTYFVTENKSGCRFLTVDAYISAVPFYEKNDFKMLGPDKDENPYTRLLFYDLNEIAM